MKDKDSDRTKGQLMRKLEEMPRRNYGVGQNYSRGES